MNLKSLFCRHIFRTTDTEILSEYIGYVMDFPIAHVYYGAIHKECIKCGKYIIKEEHHKEPLSNEETKRLWRF